eukprot:1865524-Ditylum_brightwellii.AAC.1
MSNKEINAKVAIVGAGASGLMCAHTILPHLIKEENSKPDDNDDTTTTTKLPLCILEARERIGGRIYTMPKSCQRIILTTMEKNAESEKKNVTASTTTTTTVPFDLGAAWIH